MKKLKLCFTAVVVLNLTSCIVLTNASTAPRTAGPFDLGRGKAKACDLEGVSGPAAPYVPQSKLGDDDYVKQVLASKVKEQKVFIDDLLSGELCQ